MILQLVREKRWTVATYVESERGEKEILQNNLLECVCSFQFVMICVTKIRNCINTSFSHINYNLSLWLLKLPWIIIFLIYYLKSQIVNLCESTRCSFVDYLYSVVGICAGGTTWRLLTSLSESGTVELTGFELSTPRSLVGFVAHLTTVHW